MKISVGIICKFLTFPFVSKCSADESERNEWHVDLCLYGILRIAFIYCPVWRWRLCAAARPHYSHAHTHEKKQTFNDVQVSRQKKKKKFGNKKVPSKMQMKCKCFSCPQMRWSSVLETVMPSVCRKSEDLPAAGSLPCGVEVIFDSSRLMMMVTWSSSASTSASSEWSVSSAGRASGRSAALLSLFNSNFLKLTILFLSEIRKSSSLWSWVQRSGTGIGRMLPLRSIKANESPLTTGQLKRQRQRRKKKKGKAAGSRWTSFLCSGGWRQKEPSLLMEEQCPCRVIRRSWQLLIRKSRGNRDECVAISYGKGHSSETTSKLPHVFPFAEFRIRSLYVMNGFHWKYRLIFYQSQWNERQSIALRMPYLNSFDSNWIRRSI